MSVFGGGVCKTCEENDRMAGSEGIRGGHMIY